MTPHRIQISRSPEWKLPENTVKVDRSSPWGNPFIANSPPAFLSPADSLAKFEEYAATLDLAPLRGKHLADWSPLDEPSHADILLRLANPIATLRIISNAGITYFEGVDYTTADWKPGRHIVFARHAHAIINNSTRDGYRLILVSSLPQTIHPAKEVAA